MKIKNASNKKNLQSKVFNPPHTVAEIQAYLDAVIWLTDTKNLDIINSYNEFEYPDYSGMPQSITSNLSSSHVDEIQGAFNAYKM